MDETINIFQPMLQYGFAGLSIILLAIIVWMINKLIIIIDNNNIVISKHTALIDKLNDNIDAMNDMNKELHDKLISRPCLSSFSIKNA